jgi:hypothetical protein
MQPTMYRRTWVLPVSVWRPLVISSIPRDFRVNGEPTTCQDSLLAILRAIPRSELYLEIGAWLVVNYDEQSWVSRRAWVREFLHTD